MNFDRHGAVAVIVAVAVVAAEPMKRQTVWQ
jgi:hypothetical protein